jgi:hypothetical protein
MRAIEMFGSFSRLEMENEKLAALEPSDND